MTNNLFVIALAILLASASVVKAHDTVFKIKASTPEQRTFISNLGLAIDGVTSESVLVFGGADEKDLLLRNRIQFEEIDLGLTDDFPSGDKAFRDYKQVEATIQNLVKSNRSIASHVLVGKSIEGRNISGIRLSSRPQMDSLPTAIFMGCHHAREHLSVEMPLKLAEYLVKEYSKDARIKKLLSTTEVYIIPMVNPDGAEYDISTGSYKYWRKNRRKNANSTFGVDLNRNYGGKPGMWGGPGSSGDPKSDTYRGTEAFSEPETQAIRDFVTARKKTTVLLTYHTFSELILWPYGHTNDPIPDAKDRAVFETMGKKMSTWNHYTPQKSSQLYLASGDTTDWAYSMKKIFAFTFELSPKSMFAGGFYPGAKAIEPTFNANLEPALYLIEKAQNPYAAVR